MTTTPPTMRHAARLLPPMILMLAMCDLAWAQEGTLHQFRAPQPLDRAAEKAVWTVLLIVDDQASISVFERLVKARVRSDIGSATLLEALNGTGLGPFEPIRPDVPTTDRISFDDFPQLIDTGDPDHDQTELGRAKEAWFAAHPGALEVYRTMLQQGLRPGSNAHPNQ